MVTYPVAGPVDAAVNGVSGVLDNDLDAAVLGAMQLHGQACADYALKRAWAAATEQFLDALVPALPVDALGQPGSQLGPEPEQRQGQ